MYRFLITWLFILQRQNIDYDDSGSYTFICALATPKCSLIKNNGFFDSEVNVEIPESIPKKARSEWLPIPNWILCCPRYGYVDTALYILYRRIDINAVNCIQIRSITRLFLTNVYCLGIYKLNCCVFLTKTKCLKLNSSFISIFIHYNI